MEGRLLGIEGSGAAGGRDAGGGGTGFFEGGETSPTSKSSSKVVSRKESTAVCKGGPLGAGVELVFCSPLGALRGGGGFAPGGNRGGGGTGALRTFTALLSSSSDSSSKPARANIPLRALLIFSCELGPLEGGGGGGGGGLFGVDVSNVDESSVFPPSDLLFPPQPNQDFFVEDIWGCCVAQLDLGSLLKH